MNYFAQAVEGSGQSYEVSGLGGFGKAQYDRDYSAGVLRRAFSKKFTRDLNVLELREFACTLLRLTETVSPVVQPLVAPSLVKLWSDFNFQWLGAMSVRFLHMLRE